jgi:hypothetical protein
MHEPLSNLWTKATEAAVVFHQAATYYYESRLGKISPAHAVACYREAVCAYMAALNNLTRCLESTDCPGKMEEELKSFKKL